MNYALVNTLAYRYLALASEKWQWVWFHTLRQTDIHRPTQWSCIGTTFIRNVTTLNLSVTKFQFLCMISGSSEVCCDELVKVLL